MIIFSSLKSDFYQNWGLSSARKSPRAFGLITLGPRTGRACQKWLRTGGLLGPARNPPITTSIWTTILTHWPKDLDLTSKSLSSFYRSSCPFRKFFKFATLRCAFQKWPKLPQICMVSISTYRQNKKKISKILARKFEILD